jgi:nitrite reductase/ring-hydroxylating ferredoxin subunit
VRLSKPRETATSERAGLTCPQAKDSLVVPAKSRHRIALANPPRDELRATPESGSIRYRVGTTTAVKPGHSMKFLLPIRGVDEECFVINYHGHLYAYVNQCRHVPMAMDWVDNQFFAERGRYLMCQTHNAYYQPDTGECIAGPSSACGKFLYRVELSVEHGVIYATAPDYEFSDD